MTKTESNFLSKFSSTKTSFNKPGRKLKASLKASKQRPDLASQATTAPGTARPSSVGQQSGVQRGGIVNPASIQHKKKREIKIKMLLKKPFDLTDNQILKQNQKISQ